LLGAPGAGKGTQAKLLQDSLGLPHVSTGDLFRFNLRNETKLGKLANQYMEKGQLVPDDVTIAMVRDRLSQPDCSDGAILDGFPRTVAQAEALDKLLAEFDGRITLVPSIAVEQDLLVERLVNRARLEGRTDDNEETIRTRMIVYEQQTRPLLEFYGNRGLVVEVNGRQTIEKVQAELLKVIQEN